MKNNSHGKKPTENTEKSNDHSFYARHAVNNALNEPEKH